MERGGATIDIDALLRHAKEGSKRLASSYIARLKDLRKRTRELRSVGSPAEELAVLKEWAELRAEPKVLHRLAKALRRNGDRELATRLVCGLNGGADDKQRAMQKTARQQEWGKTARAQSQANAAELQSDPQVLSILQEMIADRIGRPVRHVRSETVLKSRTNATRAHVHRRAYTKHWFEVSGTVDERVRPLIGEERLLVVFVKSASKLRLCAPLEFVLSEQGGQGFRTPYFFGSFKVSKLEVAAWESIDIARVPFKRLALEDQRRIVEAIAAVNTVRADGTVPVQTRWVNMSPSWVEARYKTMDGTATDRWKDLYARTKHVLTYQNSLADRLRSADEGFLAHNDIGLGASNIFVPPVGDVVLFDWEISTLSLPGADLGVLSRVDAGETLLSCYVAKMAEYGVKLDTDAVRFTVDVLQGFRSIQNGWRKTDVKDVELGLTLLTSHIQ